MTHVPVRAPCGARVAGLMMFPFDCTRGLRLQKPRAGVWTGYGRVAYNRGVATSLVFVRGLGPLTPPFCSRGSGRSRFSEPPFCYAVIDRPALRGVGLRARR